MALAAATYAGIKSLEERRKDLNHERNTLLDQKQKGDARLAEIDAELAAVVSDRDGALSSVSIAPPDAESYLKFDDATKTVIRRTLAEDAAAAEAAKVGQ